MSQRSVVLARWQLVLIGAVTGVLLASLILINDRATAQITPAACSARSLPPYGNGDNTHNDPLGYSTTVDMGGGQDIAEMADCLDTVYGGGGFDELHGAHGVDQVYGQADNDRPLSCSLGRCGKLFGGGGGDVINGGPGHDDLDDSQEGSDSDDASGAGGNDVINVDDGDSSDIADGGADTDSCLTDPGDNERPSCET